MLTELSLLIISYAGLFIGLLLGKITGKEVSQGKNSLQVLRNILLALSIIWFTYASPLSWIAKVIVIVVMLGMIITTDLMYAAAGILLGAHVDVGMTALLFLYGFPQGSLMHKKSLKEAFLGTWPYLAFAGISYAVMKLIF